jgi:hypothetical protein
MNGRMWGWWKTLCYYDNFPRNFRREFEQQISTANSSALAERTARELHNAWADHDDSERFWRAYVPMVLMMFADKVNGQKH